MFRILPDPRLFPIILLLGTVLFAGCGADRRVLGPRPAISLSSVAEAYMQQYQPGPLPRIFQTTFVYDRNGALLAELIGEGRREWVPLDRISPHLINATIATEDATFFTNQGIDPVRIAGAALQNVEQGEIVSGASTITMQLARNLFLGSEERYDRTFDRKIVEAGLARELTQTYRKEELLEIYLNLLNYGRLAYGPQAAARTYFGKSAAELSLAESTLLAGIPQSPARFDLFGDFEAAKARQGTVLSLMARHGFLDEEEASAVFGAGVSMNGSPEIVQPRAPHFVDYVVRELDRSLGAGFVRRAGLRIYTTLDLGMQETAQGVVTQRVGSLKSRYDMNNGALVALMPGTAEILAMVGSVDYDDREIDGQVNVATSLRQPGSSIKPLLYATAFNDELISPATVIWDTPITYTISAVEEYEPRNYDRRVHGPVTARAALANSYNIPAVKLLDAVGVERMLESARLMGVKSLYRGTDWYGLSLTLGGGEVTLLDLASAYHTIANGGRYLPPRFVLTITDALGQTLLEGQRTEGEPALSEGTAALVTDILSDNAAREPMFGLHSHLTLDRPVAAKTGTTDNNRDAWTVGYTRYLLAGVWVGNTDGRPMRNATGAAAAAPIWNEFMRAVLAEPGLLETLNAPESASLWQFAASNKVEESDACPPGLACRQGGGELFSVGWLEAVSRSMSSEVGSDTGREDVQDSPGAQGGLGGPLADSIESLPSVPVYVKRQTVEGLETQLLGFCGHAGGATRRMIALPSPFGLPQASSQACRHCWTEEDAHESEIDSDRLLRDRKAALVWSLGANFPVYLGPCEEMGAMAGYVGLAVGIDLENAETDVGAGSQPRGLLVDVTSPAATGEYIYFMGNLRHDDQCPGQYIMGIVRNSQGSAVSGVRVNLVDGWGNRYQAVSKSGVNDAGRFDFPIYGQDAPQNLVVQVVDMHGRPLSLPFVVPHRTVEGSYQPCHHLSIRRR